MALAFGIKLKNLSTPVPVDSTFGFALRSVLKKKKKQRHTRTTISSGRWQAESQKV